jgi:hypothetical protein
MGVQTQSPLQRRYRCGRSDRTGRLGAQRADINLISDWIEASTINNPRSQARSTTPTHLTPPNWLFGFHGGVSLLRSAQLGLPA